MSYRLIEGSLSESRRPVR